MTASTDDEILQEMICSLPPDQKEKVRAFVETMVQNRDDQRKDHLRLTWAGALKEYRGKYTSLELQKKASDWWDA